MHHEYNYHYCKQCHRPYCWTNSHEHIFCSVECYHQWLAEHKKPVEPPKAYEKICEWCGMVFVTNRPNQNACSRKCKYHLDYRKRQAKLVAGYVPHTYICKECGEAFTTQYGQRRTSFCSAKCYKRYNKKIWRQHQKEKNATSHSETCSD